MGIAMAQTQYTAIIERRAGEWRVRVPDVPGCCGTGSTEERAIEAASVALHAFCNLLVADGKPLPRARDNDTVMDEAMDATGGEEVTGVTIRVMVGKPRPVEATITLDANLLATIDRVAKRQGITRSDFLAHAALDEIARSG